MRSVLVVENVAVVRYKRVSAAAGVCQCDGRARLGPVLALRFYVKIHGLGALVRRKYVSAVEISVKRVFAQDNAAVFVAYEDLGIRFRLAVNAYNGARRAVVERPRPYIRRLQRFFVVNVVQLRGSARRSENQYYVLVVYVSVVVDVRGVLRQAHGAAVAADVFEQKHNVLVVDLAVDVEIALACRSAFRYRRAAVYDLAVSGTFKNIG